MPTRLLGRQVLHRAHHLAGRGQRNLVGDPGNAEVRDLDAPLGRDEQVARLDVAVHQPGIVCRVQRGCRLRDDVEHLVGGQHALPLEDRRESLPRHELHDQIGASILFAVVEDVGDSLVVDERGMPSLGAEALQKSGVTEVLVFQDLDGDGAPDDQVGRLPDLTHPADGDPRRQLVPTTEGEAACGSHLLSTASMTFFAIGAATVFPKPDCPIPPPFSTTTATATCGLLAGAKPVNKSV